MNGKNGIIFAPMICQDQTLPTGAHPTGMAVSRRVASPSAPARYELAPVNPKGGQASALICFFAGLET
jgi:hypothetical protein